MQRKAQIRINKKHTFREKHKWNNVKKYSTFNQPKISLLSRRRFCNDQLNYKAQNFKCWNYKRMFNCREKAACTYTRGNDTVWAFRVGTASTPLRGELTTAFMYIFIHYEGRHTHKKQIIWKISWAEYRNLHNVYFHKCRSKYFYWYWFHHNDSNVFIA